jgi:sodium/bile acid cotransporter 2
MYIEGAYPKGTTVRMKWIGLFVSISVVIVGIMLGLYLGRRTPAARVPLNYAGNTCGVLLVLLGFFVSSSSSSPIWDREWKFYVALIVPCVSGLVVSLGFAKLTRLEMPQALAVAIEVCYQNTAIALAVILSSFENDPSCTSNSGPTCDIVGIASGVPTFYQFVQVFSLGILCLTAWKSGWTYAPKGTPLLTAITNSFQPMHHDLANIRELHVDRSEEMSEMPRELEGV